MLKCLEKFFNCLQGLFLDMSILFSEYAVLYESNLQTGSQTFLMYSAIAV